MWSQMKCQTRIFSRVAHHRKSTTLNGTTSSLNLRSIQTESQPRNEPILSYADKDSQHRIELEKTLRSFEAQTQDVPIVINGKEHRTEAVRYQHVPFDHKERVAKFYYATQDLIQKATEASIEASKSWERVPIMEKINVFEKAADLVAGKYRYQLNAATMLGQAKTIKQAEIDSAAELADFLRFNVHYIKSLVEWQQPLSTKYESNSLRFRGLDGFVAAISPFNFTAIGANLATAPTMMGNGVVWKPSDTAMLSNYIAFKLFKEAGFPDGLINFVPAEGLDFGRVITSSSELAGINFTGSLATFQWIWNEVGVNIKRYRTFPRLVGECGGKNFHLVHKSADIDTVVAQTIRSAFEYSGQKCSACSRMYVPHSLWDSKIRDKLISASKSLKIGPSTDFSTYTSAVIDANAFKRITDYINYGKATTNEIELLCGGDACDKTGYFVQPTIFKTNNPRNRLMMEEIFGPVLTVYVYNDNEIDNIMKLIDENQYALTGAIFAKDEQFLNDALDKLRMSAGNMYLNDKSTGAVVGQQPFGGSRHSGTNDKAGGPHYLMRWCNQQTIKRTKIDLVEL